MSDGPWCDWCDKEKPSEKHLEKHRRATDVTFTQEELAEHDRQVAERAWDEGHLIHGEDYRHPHLCREGGGCIAENPYRAAKGEQSNG